MDVSPVIVAASIYAGRLTRDFTSYLGAQQLVYHILFRKISWIVQLEPFFNL
jgi:menaquinone-dependent protoporphyrinogen IX oxidase